jgi:hypothetical protein
VGVGDVLAQEVERRLAGPLEAGGRGGDGLEQPTARVHVAHHRLHGGERLGRLVDHQIGPFGHHLQLVVGDQCGDLDDDVARRVESGHLQVHPGQHERAHYGHRR